MNCISAHAVQSQGQQPRSTTKVRRTPLTPARPRQDGLAIRAGVERSGHPVEVRSIRLKTRLPLALLIITAQPSWPELRLQGGQERQQGAAQTACQAAATAAAPANALISMAPAPVPLQCSIVQVLLLLLLSLLLAVSASSCRC
jgi:hypothetical protein